MRPLPGLWGYRGSDGEVGVSEHREGDVPVPGVVAADLVVVEPDLGLGGLEAVLDRQRAPVTRMRSSSVVLLGAQHK